MRVFGVDLGQSHDPAAAALIDRLEPLPTDFIGPPDKRVLRCRGLREWPLGTDYTLLVQDIIAVESDAIVVDFGGVGRPVVDMLRKAAFACQYKGKIYPVQLMGSNTRAKEKREARGAHHNVPKIDVVTSLVVAQQSGVLTLPGGDTTAKLMQQLKDFQMRFTKAANLQFGNMPGTGKHDDIVIALGLATWFCATIGKMQPAIWCG